MNLMEETGLANEMGRKALDEWQKSLKHNIFHNDPNFQHSIALYLSKKIPAIEQELASFAEKIVNEAEPLVVENNLNQNLPRIEHYDGIGQKIETVVHHPNYEKSGNIIYSSRLLEKMSKPGGLLEALAFMFLSSQAGEAGHNCPIACSAGIIRVLQKIQDFPNKNFYIQKLIEPSYTSNFTGAQFLTEVQGGSDVALNAVEAFQDDQGNWRIKGEKWFCSNANAELMLITARFDKNRTGTKGLGLYLIPSHLESGERNYYTLRRLKDKIGTRSMASAEIDFHGAHAYPIGPPEEGFKMVMENVLHISRLFNTFCVLGMARRAYRIAYNYAHYREAFDHPIIHYPLVKENLARIKTENTALLASIFATVQLQDDLDTGKLKGDDSKQLLRLLANLNKYLSSLWSVEHIHHSLDTLAGNGAIETFSTIPRLLRDSIVCENWEGTHNTLRMQILKDISRYQVDSIFLSHLDNFITNLPDSKQTGTLKYALTRLDKDLQTFKSSSPELQSLLIKGIVDQMAILYAAAQLLQEAISNGSSIQNSKLPCFEYFTLLHLQSSPPAYNQKSLDLITSIVSGDPL